MLKFAIRTRPRKMSSTFGHGSGPSGRIERLRRVVTALIRYERLESYYHRLDEARGYAERLIHLAIKNGDTDKMTMEMADYWLLEKDLIPKLFKVLAPRYCNSATSFTQLHVLPTVYPGSGSALGILELRGNPWPPVLPKERNIKGSLVNQLIDATREVPQDRFSLQSGKLSVSEDIKNLNISDLNLEGQNESITIGSDVDPKPVDEKIS